MLNVAPASSVDLSEVYTYTDLLCVNETEVRNKQWYTCFNHLIVQAETLLGCDQLEDVTAAKRAVTQFYQKFVLSGCVVITLGSQGLVYAANPTSSVEHIPAETVTTVDTTVSILSPVC